MPPKFPSGGLAALEAELDMAASVDEVWSVVSDLRSMGERSPETVRMYITATPEVGSRGLNLNRRGAIVWPTTTRITRWKPPSHDGSAAVAFHVGPTNVEWSYELTPTTLPGGAEGTRVVERRSSLPDAGLAVRLTGRWLLGGSEHHDVELLEGMQRTLAAIKAEVEP